MTVQILLRLARRATLVGFVAFVAHGPRPARAADGIALRGDVVVVRDALTLGDLVDGVPPELAGTAVFRAPPLGQSGTIQTRRIADAAGGLGLERIETGGRLQILVTRAARHIGAGEIEAALRRALEAGPGLDPRATGVSFDGPAPSLVVAPDLKGELSAADLQYDRRSRRLAATIWIGPSPTERTASLRVTGTAVDLVEVGVVARALDRGDAIKPGDVAVERRPRESVPSDALLDAGPFAGRIARRALSVGALLRSGDAMRPELVARGEMVNVVYQVPGMALSMRAKASEAGSLGDAINVVSPGSKKPLQATIVGPGRVSVVVGSAERVVAAASTARN